MFSTLAENWLLKLLSLVFALVLWFFVMGEQRVERSYLVPLEMKNVPEGLIVANEVPSHIDVRITGPRTLLINLDEKNISIPIDLGGLKPGLTTFRRLEERLNISSGVKVTRVSPSFVEVHLDRIIQKAVPVEAVTEGSLPRGYRLVSLVVKPSLVTLEGAEGELKGLEAIFTEPIPLEGFSQNETRIAVLAYQGAYSKLSLDKVEVQLTVEQEELESQPADSGSQ